jgi:hypothetical protein
MSRAGGREGGREGGTNVDAREGQMRFHIPEGYDEVVHTHVLP